MIAPTPAGEESSAEHEHARRRIRARAAFRALCLALFAAGLTACSGGGGGDAGNDSAQGAMPPPGDATPTDEPSSEPPSKTPDEPSDESSDEPSNQPSASLAAPEGVVLETNLESVTTSWDAVPNAKGYHLYYARDPALTPENHAAQGGTWLQNVSSPYTVENLAPGTTYYFIVTAFAGAEESLPSATAAATLPISISNTATGALNDTGADLCVTASELDVDCPQPDYPQQDAEDGRDAEASAGRLRKSGAGAAGFDFTKISGAGIVLPADASYGSEPYEWACTLDNVTGLLWEVRPNQPGALRGRTQTYSWLLPDDDANGGNAGMQDGGACSGSACDTSGYVAAVNAERLCGFDDWRLPTAGELASLVHHGRTDPAIDADYFPDVPSANALYWTRTPLAADASKAWSVDFASGELVFPSKTYAAHVRLVRAAE